MIALLAALLQTACSKQTEPVATKSESAIETSRKKEVEKDLKDPVFVAAGKLQLSANRALGAIMQRGVAYYQMYKDAADKRRDAINVEFNSELGTKTSKIGRIVDYAIFTSQLCDTAFLSDEYECRTLKKNIEEFRSIGRDYM
ncbi:hypothetical protein CEJ45_15080 [Herbaspirillum aquaticum]|uniref:Uncharacterized protein n=1 Tax=Herbaspirillum aquaticum TaxID=568783 RepID=A0A225SS06_9BURK|nr:hypothetical protein CEJ45_15080 [Herbaspirillum aquaticum]